MTFLTNNGILQQFDNGALQYLPAKGSKKKKLDLFRIDSPQSFKPTHPGQSREDSLVKNDKGTFMYYFYFKKQYTTVEAKSINTLSD